MSEIFKPVVLENDGVFGQLPNGGIINSGGTSNSTFTVGGKGLLFDDGTSTAGNTLVLSLQTAYNNSTTNNGSAGITLAVGKDFLISDALNDGKYFKINAQTGKVTISGDLEVLGSSSVIDTVIQDSDHWLISPKLGTTTALKIEPDLGVIPIVDLVSIRRTFGSYPVFRIDAAGNIFATQNLSINGTINNVDIVQLKNDLDYHLSGDIGFRHLAKDIDILPIASLPGATNVQEALEQINIKADQSSGPSTSNIQGYEHIQSTPSTSWVILHNGHTFRAQVTIYDSSWQQMIPENVKIINGDTILVTFGMAVAGRAMTLLF